MSWLERLMWGKGSLARFPESHFLKRDPVPYTIGRPGSGRLAEEGRACPNGLFLFLQRAVAPWAGAGPAELRGPGRVAWLRGRPAPTPLQALQRAGSKGHCPDFCYRL